MEILASPFGELSLQRMPLTRNDPLRAWDAADEYLLQHLQPQHNQPLPAFHNAKRILVINDQFGALSLALSLANQGDNKQQIISWGDSKLSELALAHNCQFNTIAKPVQYLPSTQQPDGTFDLVIIKVPKVLGLLEHQLIGLRPFINQGSTIIAAGMSKHIHSSTLKTCVRIIGTTTTSLAVKKARLVFISPTIKADKQHDLHPTLTASPYPVVYDEPTLGITLSNHANVFSKEKLDIGARFFIENFHQLPKACENVIDLGCGNGVLTVMAGKQLPKAQFHLLDESYMAIASAQQNCQQSLDKQQCHFYISDCLSQYTGPKADLILCNPPFHQQHTVGDQIAWRMFKQSAAQLSSEGQLWVVANRHLGYHQKLKRLFKYCKTVAANKKFVILQASHHSPN